MLYGPVKSIVQHSTSISLGQQPVILSNTTTNETYALIQPIATPVNQGALNTELSTAGYNPMTLNFIGDVMVAIAGGDEIKTLTQIEESTGKIAVYMLWQVPVI